MFGIGIGELLIIAMVLLIAVGPRRLPGLMKTIGQSLRQVRKAADELRESVGIDQLLNDEPVISPPKPAQHIVEQNAVQQTPSAPEVQAPLDNEMTSHYLNQAPISGENTMQIELPDTGDTALAAPSLSALESESTALFSPVPEENIPTRMLSLPEEREPEVTPRPSRTPSSLSQIARSPFTKETSASGEKKVSFPAPRKPEGGQS